MAVTEVKSRDNLPKESPRLLRCQPAFLDEVIEELPARDVLQHQVEVLPVLVHVVQGQHVLVLYQLHDSDLPLHLLQHGLTQLLLVDDLDGDLLPQYTVSAQLNKS